MTQLKMKTICCSVSFSRCKICKKRQIKELVIISQIKFKKEKELPKAKKIRRRTDIIMEKLKKF